VTDRGGQPRNVRTLRKLVDGHARSEGIAVGRAQRWVSYMVLVGALERVRDGRGDPLFLVKGGVAIELRLGLEARATKDFDATFREAAGRMLDRLDEALREPYGGFTLTRGEIEEVGPTRAKRLNVMLAYEGRSWSTVKLELSPAEGDTALEVERVPAIDLSRFGLEGPDSVACLPLRYQIAQKLHACTALRDDGKDNDRFRDLIDLILLRGLIDGKELKAVHEACVHIFDARGQHRWPPSLVVPESWLEPYARLAADLGFEVTDVEVAADRVREIIDEIDSAGGPWAIVSGPVEVPPVADHRRYHYVVERRDERQDVFVEVTGTASAADPRMLPSPLDEAVRTRGASELVRLIERGVAPARIVISTRGATVVPRAARTAAA
jgi:Nucleotidyl transferase AbiEii toxin, Type IV TA system